jgi:site-specific recombinase XerD
MRATFITTALENGAQLEDVQKAARHRDPGTTKLYDRICSWRVLFIVAGRPRDGPKTTRSGLHLK